MARSGDRKGPGGLTKADLVNVVYQRHGGLTRDEAAEVIDTIFKTVKTTLGDGRAVRIHNFGSFEVADRKGRRGVNPASGEPIFIPPHKGLAFRPAERLKRVVKPSRRSRGGDGLLEGEPSRRGAASRRSRRGPGKSERRDS